MPKKTSRKEKEETMKSYYFILFRDKEELRIELFSNTDSAIAYIEEDLRDFVYNSDTSVGDNEFTVIKGYLPLVTVSKITIGD